jgi:hypothetical protein
VIGIARSRTPSRRRERGQPAATSGKDQEVMEQVESALARLPQRQREALVLRDMEGWRRGFRRPFPHSFRYSTRRPAAPSAPSEPWLPPRPAAPAVIAFSRIVALLPFVTRIPKARIVERLLLEGLDVYAYFNNHPQGHAVSDALELERLLGGRRARGEHRTPRPG